MMSFVWHLKIFLLKRTLIWHIVPNKTTNIDNMFFDKTKVFHTFCNKFWGVYFCPTIIILKVLNDHYFQKPNKSGEQFVRISVVCYFHWSRCWIAQCLTLVWFCCFLVWLFVRLACHAPSYCMISNWWFTWAWLSN